MNKKIAILLISLLVWVRSSAFAEMIKLKSGQEVEGQIIERTDKEIKIDFMGVPLTYFLEDIETIDEEPIQLSAQKETQEASRVTPASAEEYFYQGVANAKKGSLDRAISDFSKAIELNPDLTEAYYNRGLAFLKKNNFDFAIDDFNKAVEINPKYSEAYNNRSVAYFMKKEFELALEDLQKAEELGYKVNLELIKKIKKAVDEKKK